jgi:hypothetical protein
MYTNRHKHHESTHFGDIIIKTHTRARTRVICLYIYILYMYRKPFLKIETRIIALRGHSDESKLIS